MKNLLAVLLSLVITGAVAAQVLPPPAQPSIDLPTALDRVLRDYEKFWRAKDPAGLAALFTEDGFVLANRKPPVRGRAAIRTAYADGGGPLFLRAFAYSIDGATGYIIGGYRGQESGPDDGKFVLALRKDESGRWLIAADMDNGNRPPTPKPPDAPTPPGPPSPPPAH